MATVESPAIHIVKGGRLEGSTFATGGGTGLAGDVASGELPFPAGSDCGTAPIGNGPLAGTSLRGAALLPGAPSEPIPWASVAGGFVSAAAAIGCAPLITPSEPLLGRSLALSSLELQPPSTLAPANSSPSVVARGPSGPRRSTDPSRNEKRVPIMANSPECAGYASRGQEQIDAGVTDLQLWLSRTLLAFGTAIVSGILGRVRGLCLTVQLLASGSWDLIHAAR